MKKPALLVVLLLLVLGAREALPQASAPFVSRLRAKAGESGVQLSWRAVPGFTGSYRVYRHTREIDDASFPEAVEIGTVGAEVSVFEDFPAAGSYFYAVLLDDGELSRLLVSFRNKTSAPVKVTSAAAVRGEATRITGLTAEVSGDAVRLRFQSSRPDRELLLFRSLQAMRSNEDLSSPTLSLEAGARRYEDFPIPGLDYYYALVDAALFRLGKTELAPGQNSTLQPVRVPLGAGRVGLPPAVIEEVPPRTPPAASASAEQRSPAQRRRPPAVAVPASEPASEPFSESASEPASEQLSLANAMASARSAPLPYLDLDATRALPAPALPALRPIGPVARSTMEAVLREAPARTVPRLRAQALPEELGSGGVEAELGTLVADHLLTGQLAEAEARLLAFLSVRRTAEGAARARFYLGQVYYLQGKPSAAVLELLLARPLYYPAVQPWVENCLHRLAGP